MAKKYDRDTSDAQVSRPNYTKKRPAFLPGRMGIEDIDNQNRKQRYSGPSAGVDKPWYYAKVLRVDSTQGQEKDGDWDWFGWFVSRPIRVRAMIKPEEGVGAPLPEPSTGTNKPKDHNIIDMYPEFVGFLEDLGGIEPKVDDIIKVNFKNPNIKTKIFGNGIIVAMGEAVTKISDVEINENVLARGAGGNAGGGEAKGSFDKSGVTDRLTSCQSLGKKTTVKPSPGSPIKGENDDLVMGSGNPRQLNNPTDDQGIDPATRQPREDRTSSSNSPTLEDRNPEPPGPNVQGPPPFTAAPKPSRSEPSSGCDCERTYLMSDFNPSGNRDKPTKTSQGNVKTAQPQNVPKTRHAQTNEEIKKLHPDIRKQVAEFINDANRQGYKIKITSAYRTFQQQNKMLANGASKASGGRSYHNYGIAFDVVENPHGAIPFGFDARYPKSRWHDIGRIGKQHGFEWGGEFRSFFDGPHFQVPNQNWRKLKERIDHDHVVEDPSLPKMGPWNPAKPGGSRNYIYPDLEGLRR